MSLDRLEQLVPRPDLPVSADAAAEIARDAGSYEAILERLEEVGKFDEALRVAVRLGPYWAAYGSFAEGRERLRRLLAEAGDIPPTLRSQALERQGTMAFEQGDEEEARALMEEALACAGDDIAKARAHASLARCALMRGELDDAREHARATERIHRARDDEPALDFPLHILAYADYIAGDDDKARAGFEETLAMGRRLGNRFAVARELTNLCSVETRAGNLERARDLGREALELAVELDNPHLITYCIINLAGAASATGDHERAALLFGAGERMMAASGMALNPGTAIEYERHVARTREALGDRYEEMNRAGRELDRDEAVAAAR